VKIFKEGNLEKANQLLKGRYALTTHLPSVQQSFAISELTVEPADKKKFADDSGRFYEVVDFWKKKHKLWLKRPGLPCVVEMWRDFEKGEHTGGKGEGVKVHVGFHYWPLEVLDLLPEDED